MTPSAHIAELAAKYVRARDEYARIIRERDACTCEREYTTYSRDFHDNDEDRDEQEPCWKARSEYRQIADGSEEGRCEGGELAPFDTWCATCQRRDYLNGERKVWAKRVSARLGALISATRTTFDLPAFVRIAPPIAAKPEPQRQPPEWDDDIEF